MSKCTVAVAVDEAGGKFIETRFRELQRECELFSEVEPSGIGRKLGIANSKLDYKVARGISDLQTETLSDFVVVAAATKQFSFTVFNAIKQITSSVEIAGYKPVLQNLFRNNYILYLLSTKAFKTTERYSTFKFRNPG